MYTICGFSLEPGTKKQVILGIDMGGQEHFGQVPVIPEGVEMHAGEENYYQMPATIICGRKPGKTVLFTAGIHSSEFPGIPATIRTAAEIDPADVEGNIIMIHCVNMSGYNKRSIVYVYEDDFNLNGMYPGNPDGTAGERIAAYFVSEIFPHVDFICDFHSGGNGESMYPCLFYPVGCSAEKEAEAAAKALEIPHLIRSTARKGEIHYAAHHFNVPGFILETGMSSLNYKEWVDLDIRNIYLLLAHLSVYHKPGLDTATKPKKIYCENDYIESDRYGLWYPALRENEIFRAGDELGHLEDFFGNRLKTYYAKNDGVVFYATWGIYAEPGFPLVAVGYNKGTLDV